MLLSLTIVAATPPLQPGWVIVPTSTVIATQGGFNSAVSFSLFQRYDHMSTNRVRWWESTEITDDPNKRKQGDETFQAPMFLDSGFWFFSTFDYRIVGTSLFIKPTSYEGIFDEWEEEREYPIHDYLDSRNVLNLKAMIVGSMVSIEGFVQGNWYTLASAGEGYSLLLVGPRPSEIRGKFYPGGGSLGANPEGFRVTPNTLAPNYTPPVTPYQAP